MPLFYCTVSETSSKLSVCLDQYHPDNFNIVMCEIPHVESLKTSDFAVFKKTYVINLLSRFHLRKLSKLIQSNRKMDYYLNSVIFY